MYKIAKFEKVSIENFITSFKKLNGDVPLSIIEKIYNEIKLPKRATTGSAGYDFFLPDAICLKNGQTIVIPTGIRVKIEPGWVLQIFPRSGLGFKYRLQLDNSVGIIDSDYYNSDNEGHIFVKLSCDAYEETSIVLKRGMAFVQGVFTPFGITYDDDTVDERNGGLGSTDK